VGNESREGREMEEEGKRGREREGRKCKSSTTYFHHLPDLCWVAGNTM